MKTHLKHILPVLALLALVTSFDCTKVFNEVENIIITGNVTLEGVSDYSNITVALYHPADLDTAIVNMHKRFPSVGFELTQAAVFDHREAEPIYTTKTGKDGAYRFDNIPDGVYNVVASKDGYGWRYIYNVDSKTAPADVRLQPEIVVDGDLGAYTAWGAYQHIIVKGDVIVPENGQLIIDKGVVVRFEGNTGLENSGSLKVNGEADAFVWFTLNQIELGSNWSGIEVRDKSSNADLKWARVDNGLNGILCRGATANIEFCFIEKNKQNGVFVASEGQANIKNNLISDCAINLYAESKSIIKVEHNIIFKTNNSIAVDGVVSAGSESEINSNCICRLNKGIKIEFESVTAINNNYITYCETGLYLGSTYGITQCWVTLNTIYNIYQYPIEIHSNIQHSISQNNLSKSDINILLIAFGFVPKEPTSILVPNNYWGCTSNDDIYNMIQDKRYNNENNFFNDKVMIEPISLNEFNNAYPK